MSVLSIQQEKYHILLEQMKLSPEILQHPLIKQGQMKQVKVLKAERKWLFYLQFAEILPFELYHSFVSHLEAAFKNIAEVQLFIEAENTQFNQQLLQDYYSLALVKAQCDTPMLQQALKGQKPILNGNKIYLSVSSESIMPLLSQQYLPKIEKNYQQFGFPRIRLNLQLDAELASLEQQAYEEHQQAQAQIMMENAAKAIANQEKRKQEKVEEGASFSGPIQLGREINPNDEITPMVEIVEEENRVLFEGYIFDIEIRELRSKRSLLQIKITDYTSSFIVKRFSNNDKDVELFNAMKKGICVKSRGSIQEDSF